MGLTILILGAGVGSRYGYPKQLEPVGPAGETLIDYALYDAIRTGFTRAIILTRRDIEDSFRDTIGKRCGERIALEYVYQDLNDLPNGFTVPSGRQKPWGTGHAVLSASKTINEPFAVINGDDFYGQASFQVLSNYLIKCQNPVDTDYAFVGFLLKDTLSSYSTVSRAICRCDSNGFLKTMEEYLRIEKNRDVVQAIDELGKLRHLTGNEVVSMNMWGFTPSLFAHLSAEFVTFLHRYGMEKDSEFFLPHALNNLIAQGSVRVKMLSGGGQWFGITYIEDKLQVIHRVKNLIDQGQYPECLWSKSQ